jgi:hypothetical protein
VEGWLLRVLGEEEPVAPDAPEPWRALLSRAEARRAQAEQAVDEAARSRLEAEPAGRERRPLERDFEEAARRDGRRARTEVLDLALTLSTLFFRDLGCLRVGADTAVLAVDRRERLAEIAAERDPYALRTAAEACEEVRASLELNVNEELALAALGFRLGRLLGRSA